MRKDDTRRRTEKPRFRHAEAAATLGRRIVSGTWPPGSVLPTEEMLCRELSVSRPAVREAIKMLAGKGLVQSSPRRGTSVRPTSAWNLLDSDVLTWRTERGVGEAFIHQIYELRQMIEPEAAGLAAARGTPSALAEIARHFAELARHELESEESIAADLAFHHAILTAAGNDFLAAFAPAMEASMMIAFKTSRARMPTHDHVLPMHRAVADAIAARNADGARAAMRALIERSERDAIGVGEHAMEDNGYAS